ncbi:hypothetical protein FSARC_6250 [Fusarium sarcochroum]|uniref:Uncharacterized protein n=1 Tax=Fusarium sarcochroum TaxID=1208366 RepID=A0A8H4X9A4_9HYPO|nr:hypothetical protein FSARC_6250 [Fusarium sarcochroum]
MTTRNLNKTWRDVVFEQYPADLESDSPFPISYLIFVPKWKKDNLLNIPDKIEIKVFKSAVLEFARQALLDSPNIDSPHHEMVSN